MAEEMTEQQKAEIAAAQQTNQQTDAPRDLRELIEQFDAPILPKPDVDKPEKPEKKKLTKEEIAQATDALGDRLGFRKEKKADEKKNEKTGDDSAKQTDDQKAAEEAAAAAAAAAEKEKQKKVKVTKKEPAPDPSDLAAITAAKTARAVAEELRQSAPKPEKADPIAAVESTLLPDEQSDLAVYKQMAEDNPAYKELPRQYLAFIQRLEAYKSKWEKENPGEEFNPDDDVHDAFYKTATPQFNPRDFHKAEVRLEAKQFIDQREEKERPKQIERQAEEAKTQLVPVIQQTKLDAAIKVVQALGDDFLPMIEKDGFEKFAEVDPVAADAVKLSAAKLNNFLEAARQFDDPKGRIPYNPQDPGHREYGAYLMEKEQELSRKPLKQRYDDEGRLFLPRHEYLQIPPAKRGDYWFYDAEKLIELRVAEQVDEAKEYRDAENKKLEKLAKARGWATNGKEENQRALEKKKAEEPKLDTDEIRSPEAGGGGKVDAPAGGDQKNSGSFFDRSAEILFRR